MKLEINIDNRLSKLLNMDVNNVIQRALIQSSLLVSNTAKDLAPYLTGSLKRSIGTDFSNISSLYTIIGSRLPYARIRNFVNNKNPHTIRYMFRGYEQNEDRISKIFHDAIQNSFK